MNIRMPVIFLVVALAAIAQTPISAPAPAPAAGPSFSIASVLTDPANIPVWTFLATNVADAKTDWHLSLGQKTYNITPGQRTAIMMGTAATVIYLKHQFPNNNVLKWVTTIAATGATAYMGGKALASTYNQGGTPTTAIAAARTQAVAFQFRFGR
jgi:hypothetical protein